MIAALSKNEVAMSALLGWPGTKQQSQENQLSKPRNPIGGAADQVHEKGVASGSSIAQKSSQTHIGKSSVVSKVRKPENAPTLQILNRQKI